MVGRRARLRRLATALAAGILLLSGAAALRAPAAQALENGVARTPPMGWNSWNTFGCNINETLTPGCGIWATSMWWSTTAGSTPTGTRRGTCRATRHGSPAA